jgi:hypothetical protein
MTKTHPHTRRENPHPEQDRGESPKGREEETSLQPGQVKGAQVRSKYGHKDSETLDGQGSPRATRMFNPRLLTIKQACQYCRFSHWMDRYFRVDWD